MKICPNCGNQNEDNAKFCGSCGTKLVDVAVQASQEAQSLHDEQVSPENQNTESHKVDITKENVEANAPAQGQAPVQGQAPAQGQAQVQGQAPAQGQMPTQPQYNNSNNMNMAYGNGNSAPIQQAKPARNLDKNTMIIIGEAVALVVAIVIFFFIGNSTYGYKNTAKRFFEGVIKADSKAIVQASDVDDKTFLTDDIFKKVYDKDGEYKADNFDMTSSYADRVQGKVYFSYLESGSGEKSSYTVTVNKKNGKSMLFFPKWEVKPTGVIIKDFKFKVPTGADLKIEGKKVDKKYITQKNKKGVDVYTIKDLFVGTYEVEVNIKGLKSVPEMVDVYSNDGVYYVTNVSMDEKSQNKLLDQGYDDMTKICESALQGKKFSDVSNLFVKDSDTQDEAKKEYDDFVDSISTSDDESGIVSFDLKNVNGKVKDVSIVDGRVVVSISYSFKENVVYNRQIFFGDGCERENYDAYDSYDVSYSLENGKWKISNPRNIRMVYYY